MKPFLQWIDRWSFRASVRRRVWKRLAAQIRHGMPLDQALRLQRDRSAAKPVGRVFSAIYAAIDSGHPLRIALEPFAPVNEVLLVSSGQKAGNLPEGFVMATEIIDAVQRLRRAVIRATAMPLLLFFLTLLLLVVIALYMIPEFSLLTDPEKWQGSARTIYIVSNFIASPLGGRHHFPSGVIPFRAVFQLSALDGQTEGQTGSDSALFHLPADSRLGLDVQRRHVHAGGDADPGHSGFHAFGQAFPPG